MTEDWQVLIGETEHLGFRTMAISCWLGDSDVERFGESELTLGFDIVGASEIISGFWSLIFKHLSNELIFSTSSLFDSIEIPMGSM